MIIFYSFLVHLTMECGLNNQGGCQNHRRTLPSHSEVPTIMKLIKNQVSQGVLNDQNLLITGLN